MEFIEGSTFTSEQVANISGYIRKNDGLTISHKDIGEVRHLRTPTVVEKGLAVLLAFSTMYPEPGARVQLLFSIFEGRLKRLKAAPDGSLEAMVDKPLSQLLYFQGVASARSATELSYLFHEYLKPQGYLDEGGEMFRLTPRGWATAEQARLGFVESNKVFVAMAFKDALNPLYEDGLSLGIRMAGYEPLRIDRVAHNNRIDDEIVARIRASKLLVADFTMNRGGIYFEAGLALGFGRPVIWTIRRDRLARVHFDNRQYNFITWESDKLTHLAEALRHRIEATAGRGTLPPIAD